MRPSPSFSDQKDRHQHDQGQQHASLTGDGVQLKGVDQGREIQSVQTARTSRQKAPGCALPWKISQKISMNAAKARSHRPVRPSERRTPRPALRLPTLRQQIAQQLGFRSLQAVEADPRLENRMKPPKQDAPFRRCGLAVPAGAQQTFVQTAVIAFLPISTPLTMVNRGNNAGPQCQGVAEQAVVRNVALALGRGRPSWRRRCLMGGRQAGF